LRNFYRKRTDDEKEDLHGQEKKMLLEETSESESDSDDSDLEVASSQVAKIGSQQVAKIDNQLSVKRGSQQIAEISIEQFPKLVSKKSAEANSQQVDEVKSQQGESVVQVGMDCSFAYLLINWEFRSIQHDLLDACDVL